MEFDDDLIACAQLVERADPERFRSLMAAPVQARAKLFPIFAFNIEAARAPWVTQETMIAEMRLQWWRDALEEIRSGKVVRRHEVVTPLARVLDAASAELLDRGLAARRWDIYRDPFEDAAHFDRYIEETGGHLMVASARALGGTDDAAALNLGYAAGLAAYLCAVPELESRGRVPLVDGRPDAVATLAQRGLERLTQARRGDIPKAAALVAWAAGPLLRLAARQPGRVASGDLYLSGPVQRLRLMWQAATGRW
ncbi:squalene/phytoene synthase family protein [Puniceibacterium sediminis]|uniref:Phytoene/squalene synthetase n=1 Tax=Puniceibacterium sediminis TaxID=1608407 RepID=A0A238W586_9RHOB|nr:squalene/phytoene synthase family protein [Puniceibacterium sediminis]SNR41712.1 Phytoene/squalene synthetase [Puniceibacterium sediminis]